MAASGIPMFMPAAVIYSASIPLVIKLGLLISALALQFAIHKISGMYDGSVAAKLAKGLSLVCWFAVAYAGRGIACEALFGTGA
jgi:hypothetical protein